MIACTAGSTVETAVVIAARDRIGQDRTGQDKAARAVATTGSEMNETRRDETRRVKLLVALVCEYN